MNPTAVVRGCEQIEETKLLVGTKVLKEWNGKNCDTTGKLFSFIYGQIGLLLRRFGRNLSIIFPLNFESSIGEIYT